MKDYYAQSEHFGMDFGHSFEATNRESAQHICGKMGWTLIGEYIDDDVPEVEAMLELRMTNPRVH